MRWIEREYKYGASPNLLWLLTHSISMKTTRNMGVAGFVTDSDWPFWLAALVAVVGPVSVLTTLDPSRATVGSISSISC